MQAQKSAPLDMQCKDKFLIQSTVAPFGTSEEDIMPGLVRVIYRQCNGLLKWLFIGSYSCLMQFSKDSGNYIEECKLRVFLASPSHSPVLSPVNGIGKQEPSYVISTQKEKLLTGAENYPPPQMVRDSSITYNLFLDSTFFLWHHKPQSSLLM